jgi:hypothetical protein
MDFPRATHNIYKITCRCQKLVCEKRMTDVTDGDVGKVRDRLYNVRFTS